MSVSEWLWILGRSFWRCEKPYCERRSALFKHACWYNTSGPKRGSEVVAAATGANHRQPSSPPINTTAGNTSALTRTPYPWSRMFCEACFASHPYCVSCIYIYIARRERKLTPDEYRRFFEISSYSHFVLAFLTILFSFSDTITFTVSTIVILIWLYY